MREKLLKILDEIKKEIEKIDKMPKKEWDHKKGKILRLLNELEELLEGG